MRSSVTARRQDALPGGSAVTARALPRALLCQGHVMPRPSAAELVSDLAVAFLGAPLTLGMRCWDGSEVPGPPGAPTLVVASPRALRRILYARDELGLARA